MIPLAVVSVVMLAVRLYAATRVGFGDSEALYASWAAHPQPAYLDHPGLVGHVARVLGGGGPPSPTQAHVVTALVATAVPWLVHAAARVFGATPERAARAAIVVAVVPEIAVGLFALTPDLLLAPAWLGSLALAAIGLRAPAGSGRGVVCLLGAGLLAGIGAAAKVSGVLLGAALATTYASVARSKLEEAKVARSIWPWAGLGAGFVVVVPIAVWELDQGWPMLRHRLVDSQRGMAFSNAIATIAGQLVYVSPVLLVLAFVVARDLLRRRNEDTLSRLAFYAFAVPIVPLAMFSIWSPVSEPHWIAPALLSLPLHAAARTKLPERRVRIGALLAAAFTVLAHAWVLIPQSARLVPHDVDPKADIANELYGWPEVLHAVRAQMSASATPYDPGGEDVVLVGPHWTICAQLQAGLPKARVGCATPIPDDFDRWLPRSRWREASDVVWVTDNRFASDGQAELPRHVRVGGREVKVLRGGRVARVFTVAVYARRATSHRGRPAPVRGDAPPDAIEEREAADHVRDADVRPVRRDEDRPVPERDEHPEDGEHVAPRSARREADRGQREDDDEDARAHQGDRPSPTLELAAREDDAHELEARLGCTEGGGYEAELLGSLSHAARAFTTRAYDASSRGRGHTKTRSTQQTRG